MRVYAILVSLVLLLSAGTARCADSGVSGEAQGLEITSASMEADGSMRQVVFVGDVVARQDGLLIRAAKLTVSYEEPGNRISRVEAIGDVQVEKDGRVATGDRGLYEVGKGSILLSGSARVQQGDNSVEGDEIVYFLEENRSIVRSKTGSRVRAVLTPGENAGGP